MPNSNLPPQPPFRRTLIVVGDAFEIYTEYETHRLQHPTGNLSAKDLGPESTFVTTLIASYGSRNLSIARTILQADEIIRLIDDRDGLNKSDALAVMHSCKESLLACETIAEQVTREVARISNDIRAGRFWKEGQSIQLPQLDTLNRDVSAYLVSINKSVRKVCELVHLVLKLPRKDNNFKDLANSLKRATDIDSRFLVYVESHVEPVSHIVNLRNADEHPGKTKLRVRNFELVGPLAVSEPTWELYGTKKSPQRCVAKEMGRLIDYVREVAENVLLFTLSPMIREPLHLQQIRPENIDPAWPIRFRVIVDASKFRFEG